MMRCLLLAFAAAIAVDACSMPSGLSSNPGNKDNTGFVDCNGRLKLKGTKIVNERGQQVQLTGMSSHGLHWFPACYSKESIQFLAKNWGMNVFRAAMYIGEHGYSEKPELKQTMKNIVKWCKEIGIYVLIDWHILVPGNPNDGVYSGAKAFFDEMSKEYAGEKHVLYEICNEPNGVSWEDVRSYANGIIPVIRRNDPEGIIIVGTPTWSQDIHLAAANPVSDPYNVMYTFHFYAGTHMNLLSRVEEYSSKIPIFATEWGTSEASGDGGPFLSDAKKFLDTFKKLGISWSQWSYADKDEKSAALKPGVCARKDWDATSCSGDFLKNYMKQNAQTCSGGGGGGGGGSPPAPRPVSPPAPRPPTSYNPPSSPPSNGGNNGNGGNGGSCAAAWDNCASSGCCVSGYNCVRSSQWYAQCKPSGGASPPSSPPRPSPSRPSPPRPSQPRPSSQGGNGGNGGCTHAWGNCKDSGCCVSGFSCERHSQYYSQCKRSGGNSQPQPSPPRPSNKKRNKKKKNNNNNGGCTGAWDNCKDTGCCVSGYKCTKVNKWYSQCKK